MKHVKRFPLLHNIYNNSFNPKKEGKKNKDIKDLYGKNIEGFKKVLYEKSMNFVFYNKCEKIKNVIKFRFCLKNTNKNTRELGINLI